GPEQTLDKFSHHFHTHLLLAGKYEPVHHTSTYYRLLLMGRRSCTSARDCIIQNASCNQFVVEPPLEGQTLHEKIVEGKCLLGDGKETQENPDLHGQRSGSLPQDTHKRRSSHSQHG